MAEPAGGVGDLGGVVVEDQDGVRLPLVDFLSRADTVVAFFYTRCQNPNKCSLTITKLADLQARMLERGLAGQLAAISYDPGFDLPPRLAAYGRARGLQFGHSVRMFRAIEGQPRLAEFFGLRVGYTGTIVNQHGLELYLVDAGVQIVADLGAHSLGNSRCSRCFGGPRMNTAPPDPIGAPQNAH